MYNRYIPQADGSYHRRQIPDAPRQMHHTVVEGNNTPPDGAGLCNQSPKKQEPNHPRCAHCSHGKKSHSSRQDSQLQGIGSFLSQFLPKDFDTADLMVILLLLLMSGDCQEDQNSALLTLALYLFL